jgi:hypothetical protein
VTAPTYEWGVREDGCHPDWIRRVVRDGAFVNVPHTEDTARAAARSGYVYETALIRHPAGAPDGEYEVVPYEPPTLTPTVEEVCHDRHGGVDLGVLGEDGDWVIALGWVDRAQMAHAVSLYTRSLGEPAALYKPGAVRHVHAVMVEAWGMDWPWEIAWARDGRPVCSAEPGAFRLTCVDSADRADQQSDWRDWRVAS